MTVERSITIKNKQGLHARPAALFVQMANKFNSEIVVSKGKQKVNGKSIMGIMMLEAGYGSKVVIAADGDDAEQTDGSIVAIHDLLVVIEFGSREGRHLGSRRRLRTGETNPMYRRESALYSL